MPGEIKPLYGFQRSAADMKIIAWMSSNVLGGRKRLGLGARQLYKFFKNQFLLASGIRANKYVEFNGKIFMDVFAPYWPSNAMKKMLETYAMNADKPPHERRDFIDYMVFAITNRCKYRCRHCYTVHTLQDSNAVPFDKLLEITKKLINIGVGILSFEGGEPLLRYEDLLVLVKTASDCANPAIATTGYSLTAEKAEQLAKAGLAAAQISLDHYDPDKHNAFRRNKHAFDAAVNAVRFFREAGVFPAIALVPDKQMVNEGGLYKYLEMAKQIGAGYIQVIDPMPSGNYLESGEATILDSVERQKILDFHVEINTSEKYKDYPGISARAYIEDESRYGCGMAGNQHCYIDNFGNVGPCSFMNLSLGNIMEEDFDVIFKRMRKLFPHPVGGVCPVYEVSEDIKKAKIAEESMPLRRELSEPILARIAKRPLPEIFKKAEGG